MTETRGYQTINDRTDGWGVGVVEADQPDADATPETTDDRLERIYLTREVGTPTTTPETHDRSRGKGATFAPASGADAGYVADKWENSAATIATDYTLEVSGSNVDQKDTYVEASANRTALALPTSDLTAPGIETVGSIVDRTDGWGHTAGSQSDRKDA